LKGVLNVRDPYGRIARWFALLSQFNYEVNYLKGTENVSADVMSRVYGDLDDNKLAELEAKCTSLRKEVVNAFIQYNRPTDEDFINAQREDPEILKVIRYLESNELPEDNKEAIKIVKESSNFVMKDKLIYRNTISKGKTDAKQTRRTPVLWVPNSMRREILIETHDSMWEGAHMGRDKTIDKINQKYYFKNIPKYVNLWIRTCSICNRTKRRHPRNHQTSLGEVPVTKAYELLCIDIWEPGCKSNCGRSYVLTAVDAFTKYAWAIAMNDDKSSTIALALLEHIFAKFPMFERVHSDRGENFIGEVMTHLYDMCKINKSQTSAYHPQSNTYAERIHQFFKNAITSYVNRNQRDWDIILAIVLRCYLQSVHESLEGFSPAQMVFGRSLGGEIDPSLKTDSKKEFVHRLNSALLEAQKLILQSRDSRKSKRKVVEVKHKSNLKPGDLIGIKVRRVPAQFESNKLYIRYKGPFVISRITQEGRVIRVIDPISGEEDPTPISNSEVKKFSSRKETQLGGTSSEEESYDISSGIDEIDSIDDFRLEISSEEEKGTKTRLLRSNCKPKEDTLAKKSDDVVQEPNQGFRNIMVQPASKIEESDSSMSDDDDMDIMGNPIRNKKELALFIHTYI
jgi:transposase InsO family protein